MKKGSDDILVGLLVSIVLRTRCARNRKWDELVTDTY